MPSTRNPATSTGTRSKTSDFTVEHAGGAPDEQPVADVQQVDRGPVPATLIEALARFQAQVASSVRGGTGAFGKYTTIADVCEALKPAAELGLCHTETFEPGPDGLVLTTTLWHTSGQCLRTVMVLPQPEASGRQNAAQALGSLITYYRRYAILAMYGLAPEDDDGAKAVSADQTKTVSKANDDFI